MSSTVPSHIDIGAGAEGSQSVEINGGRIAYELFGPKQGQPLVLTPGGRFSKDVPGVRRLAQALAHGGLRVLLWDRPNTGASDVQFTGLTESHMRADTLAALLKELDLAPAVIAGGSGGARESMLTVILHPEVATKLIVWNITGGIYGQLVLASVYVIPSIVAYRQRGLEGVLEMDEWKARIEANPRNRERLVNLGGEEFNNVMMRWLNAYVPKPGQTIPGVPDTDFQNIKVPAMIIRGGENDDDHPKRTSMEVHCLIKGSKLVDPPWPEDAWQQEVHARAQGRATVFDSWVQAAPTILDFVATG
jgi:2-hydroxy-6-oxonona-2,4-dienedioate hydrolase